MDAENKTAPCEAERLKDFVQGMPIGRLNKEFGLSHRKAVRLRRGINTEIPIETVYKLIISLNKDL